MMRTILLLLLMLPLAGCVGPSVKYTTFGSPVSGTSLDAVELTRVLESPQQFTDRPIEIHGKVVDVCQKKGCWLTMAPSGEESGEAVFVKFTCPIEDVRLIPMAAVGQTVRVEGTLVVEKISEAERRHYASEGGASDEEIEKIVGGETQIRISSGAAHVEGLENTAGS